MAWWKILLIGLAVLVLGGVGVAWYIMNFVELDMYVPLYTQNCAGCHGNEMQGTDRGVALLGGPLSRGDSVDQLQVSIRQAHPALGNPAFAGALTDIQVKGLSIYIGERRLGQRFTDFRFDHELVIPDDLQVSEKHSFRIVDVATGLDPMVFSIEPLPDGSMLLTEKERGLSIVSAAGVQSELIEGTPEMGSSVDIMGIQYGSGWLLDVAIHPQYEENGWVYLHYTHLCGEACGASMLSATMNRLDRGRIRDGQWVDVQTIWQSPMEFYSPTPDTGAGGRIAFDDSGHVYISLGIKSTDGGSDTTAQDLRLPYGKILRLRDDGTIPLDNPYFIAAQEGRVAASAVTPAIWSYGHRSPQGLEWHPERGTVWDSEMGPRGGDELNELLPGRNYGWPYVSAGLEYSGYVVERHKPKAIEFDDTVVEYSLVDITPSPAISSFAFYTGEQFPNWRNDVLIGSLKGSSLFRMTFQDRELIEQETLIKDLARIRDVEVGYDGLVYLLLENEAGSAIVKLVPG
ncbi:MAG: PQQ-dependent sugar dehydrogenase [bacterium]